MRQKIIKLVRVPNINKHSINICYYHNNLKGGGGEEEKEREKEKRRGERRTGEIFL